MIMTIAIQRINQAIFNNTALLLLSGGTTGIPKLIPRRHCDYIYVAKQCTQRWFR